MTPDLLSARMRKAAQNVTTEGMTFGEILEIKGTAAALGGLLTVLAVPATLPSTGIPIGTVMSLGIFAIAFAMLIGAETVKLPHKLLALKLSPATARRLLNGLAKVYGFMERWARPRLPHLTTKTAQRWLSLMVFVMAFIIFLPIPFGNTLPALALLILGPALIYRDGLAVLVSFGMAAIALAVTGGFFIAGFWAAGQIL